MNGKFDLVLFPLQQLHRILHNLPYGGNCSLICIHVRLRYENNSVYSRKWILLDCIVFEHPVADFLSVVTFLVHMYHEIVNWTHSIQKTQHSYYHVTHLSYFHVSLFKLPLGVGRRYYQIIFNSLYSASILCCENTQKHIVCHLGVENTWLLC